MKFEQLYGHWLENKKMYVKESTISAYMLLARNHIIPAFGAHEEILESDVQKFAIEKIQSGLSQKSVKDVLIVLKMVLKYGRKRKLIDYEVFSDIEYPTNHFRNKIDTLNVDSYKKLILYLNTNFTFRNLGILITMSTGLRIGEICGLKWEDIDMENEVIKVRRTIQRIYTNKDGIWKTKLVMDNPKTVSSNREVPMSADLIKIFKSLQKIINKDFYVLTNEPSPTEPRTYRCYYKDLMEKAGVPLIKFHGLRHTFATQCIAANVDVKTVSVLLGHSKVGTTFDLYVHPDMAQKKTAIGKLFKAMR